MVNMAKKAFWIKRWRADLKLSRRNVAFGTDAGAALRDALTRCKWDPKQ